MSKNIHTIIKNLSEKITITEADCENETGLFLSADKDTIIGRTSEMILPKVKHWLALARTDPYWNTPFFGSDLAEIPSETQFLLWENIDDTYGIILPLIEGDLRTTISGSNNGIKLVICGALKGQEPQRATIGFIAEGINPYELTHNSVKALSKNMGGFKLREEKNEPDYINYLGWCTWDAFRQAVDEAKVIDGLRSFKDGGVQPGFMILDDGGLDTEGDFLNDFAVDPVKFPGGLKKLTKKAKEEYNIKLFGIWHAFQGYWAGINPKGKLAEEYKLIPTTGMIRPWENKLENLYLVDPKEIYRFYNDFYRFLYSEGIDLLKVDGQSALEIFTDGVLGRVSTMRSYQEAFQGAATLNFGTNFIHCMCNGSDVAYNTKVSMGWRNSVDYFPNSPVEVQQKHVYINVMNNMWSSHFAIPDWDMFQSHNKESAFHAAARAISGGPIYVCDSPHKQNFELLKKLCLSDGTVLRCDKPAVPARDCLFVDCYRQDRLLKAVNYCGAIGVLGLFHCREKGGTIVDTFSPGDNEALLGDNYAVYLNTKGVLKVLTKDEKLKVTLEPMDYEIATISPIDDYAAPLGLLHKLNTAGALVSWEKVGDSTYRAILKDGGLAGFYCKYSPKSVYVNDILLDYTYDTITGLLIVNIPTGRETTIIINK